MPQEINPRFIPPDLMPGGFLTVLARLDQWVEEVYPEAAREGAREWAALIENRMQTDARWADRTGHARQSLRAFVAGDDPRIPSFADVQDSASLDTEEDIVVIVTGFMSYQQYLETMQGGRFAVLWPTVTENSTDFVNFVVDRVRSRT
jgi:phenylalanine-4-hydroxylase